MFTTLARNKNTLIYFAYLKITAIKSLITLAQVRIQVIILTQCQYFWPKHPSLLSEGVIVKLQGGFGILETAAIIFFSFFTFKNVAGFSFFMLTYFSRGSIDENIFPFFQRRLVANFIKLFMVVIYEFS